jgi:hypothetical protein
MAAAEYSPIAIAAIGAREAGISVVKSRFHMPFRADHQIPQARTLAPEEE